MTRLFKLYDVNEETPVQYVGVYTLRWRSEWGEPTVMFAEVDDPVYDAAPELLEACKAALFVLEHAHSVADDCYDQVSGAMQEILNDMLPAEDDNTGVTNKLRAAIAKAEGEQ
jgi:hypothetical protein